MTNLLKIALLSSALAATTVTGAKGAKVSEAPKQEVVESTENSILNDYIQGVDKDTNEFTKIIDKTVNEYVEDTAKYVNDFIQNPGSDPEDFADAIEKRSEDFADILEAVGDAYGNTQGNNGEAFGEKFDKDTAESVVNVVFSFLGKRR